MNKLCFVALPYCSSDLHLGRLGGTFIPADIFRRFNILFQKEKCFIVSGVDCYGYGVYLEGYKEDLNKYVERKKKNIFKILNSFSIPLVYKFSTMDHSHKDYVHKKIDQLIKSNKVCVEERENWYCNTCKKWLDDRFLVDKDGKNLEKLFENNKSISLCTFCVFCEKQAEKIKTKVLVLNKFQNPSKQISRNFLEWGLMCSEEQFKLIQRPFTYYVWIEALYSYPEQYEKLNSNFELYYFYAKDNKYYHEKVYPFILPLNLQHLSPLTNRIFCRNYFLNGNKKISGSEKNTLISINNFNKDLLRYAIAKIDTLRSDSCVTEDLLKENIKEYFNKYVNLVKRVQILNRKRNIKKIKSSIDPLYFQYMRENDLVKSLKVIEETLKRTSKEIEELVLRNKKQSRCYNDTLNILKMLEPFTPKTSKLLNKFLRKNLDFTYDKETLSVIS